MSGFAETRRTIEGMARDGIRPAAIAQTLDVDPDWCRAVINRARKRDPSIPRFNTLQTGEQFCTVTLPRPLVEQLARQAARRGLSHRQCAARLLHHALRDDLVDAILDDNPTA